MSKVTVTESHLEDIADAIRSKLGNSQGYTPGQMAGAINSIPTGGITPTGTINITQNGQTDVTQYATADVNVPNSYAASDEGKVVSNGALVAQTSDTVTQNGTYDTTTKNEVVVNVSGGSPNLQNKTVTENGTYTADTGYDGLGTVTVNVSGGGTPSVPSEYQEVEYIECYGNQYILESSLNLQQDDVIHAFASLDSSVSSSTEDGVMGGNASDTFEVYFYNSKLSYYGKISGTETSGIVANTKYEILGTMNAAGTNFSIGRYTSTYKHKGKIWTVEVSNGRTNAVYRRYVPCYRKADSKPGFYEVIRGKFFTNSGGSPDFGVGPDVA